MAYEGFLKILFNESVEEADRKRVLPFANTDLYQANIKQATKLTRGGDVKDAYDIVLDVKNITYSFQPGDTIGILPENNYEEVSKIFERLECTQLADDKCSIILLDTSKQRQVIHLPVHTTLRDVFLKYVDIRSPPKKTFLKLLLQYTLAADDKHMLQKLSSPTNSEDYVSFLSTEGRNLLRLLNKFPSCKVPIERVLEHLPPLQPRAYSISSSPLLEDELHITFSVEYFDIGYKGVCSGWLENLILPILRVNKSVEYAEKISINFYFRKPNSFQLNSDSTTPIIMIGPGTGVAPFRSFLEHLSLQKKVLDTWLFYGCRYKHQDYLYRSNLEEYLKNKYLGKLSLAFSREQDIKVYVQDLVKNEPEQIFNKLVKEEGFLYICGNIKDMMRSIRISIQYCLMNGGMSTEEANSYILEMIRTKRYVEDKWF